MVGDGLRLPSLVMACPLHHLSLGWPLPQADSFFSSQEILKITLRKSLCFSNLVEQRFYKGCQ